MFPLDILLVDDSDDTIFVCSTSNIGGVSSAFSIILLQDTICELKETIKKKGEEAAIFRLGTHLEYFWRIIFFEISEY